MKKYFVAKKVVRFIVVLLMCIVLINNFISEQYKNVNAESNNENVEVENLEQFVDNFSIISEQVKEEYYGDFVLFNIPLSEELQFYTFEMSKKYDTDYMLVMSVFATESEFKSNTKSKNQVGGKSSVGIGQLNENYIEWFGELTGIKNFDIYDNRHNIEGSIAVLKFYNDYWKNNVEGISEEDLWYYALNSYNLGIEGFKKYVRNTGKISRSYDKKVLKNKIKLEMDGGI
jgi:hypothetical protein